MAYRPWWTDLKVDLNQLMVDLKVSFGVYFSFAFNPVSWQLGITNHAISQQKEPSSTSDPERERESNVMLNMWNACFISVQKLSHPIHNPIWWKNRILKMFYNILWGLRFFHGGVKADFISVGYWRRKNGTGKGRRRKRRRRIWTEAQK